MEITYHPSHNKIEANLHLQAPSRRLKDFAAVVSHPWMVLTKLHSWFVVRRISSSPVYKKKKIVPYFHVTIIGLICETLYCITTLERRPNNIVST